MSTSPKLATSEKLIPEVHDESSTKKFEDESPKKFAENIKESSSSPENQAKTANKNSFSTPEDSTTQFSPVSPSPPPLNLEAKEPNTTELDNGDLANSGNPTGDLELPAYFPSKFESPKHELRNKASLSVSKLEEDNSNLLTLQEERRKKEILDYGREVQWELIAQRLVRALDRLIELYCEGDKGVLNPADKSLREELDKIREYWTLKKKLVDSALKKSDIGSRHDPEWIEIIQALSKNEDDLKRRMDKANNVRNWSKSETKSKLEKVRLCLKEWSESEQAVKLTTPGVVDRMKDCMHVCSMMTELDKVEELRMQLGKVIAAMESKEGLGVLVGKCMGVKDMDLISRWGIGKIIGQKIVIGDVEWGIIEKIHALPGDMCPPELRGKVVEKTLVWGGTTIAMMHIFKEDQRVYTDMQIYPHRSVFDIPRDTTLGWTESGRKIDIEQGDEYLGSLWRGIADGEGVLVLADGRRRIAGRWNYGRTGKKQV